MNEIKSKLEKRGKFFCPAKWQELYLYLNHGNTNSCSHPIPHKIPQEELNESLFALHNTKHKMKVQQQMLNNEIPDECHMCWHLENKGIMSDRFVRGSHWESSIDNLKVDKNHIPKFIEVVFDNLCNLSCSYCDSGQSSKWTNILEKTGPWEIETDDRNLYNKINIKSGFVNKTYIDAWNNWWPLIKNQVEFLKISGGEPLISPNFWNTVYKVDESNLNLNLSINSNMCFDKKYILKLIEIAKNYKTIKISASIDATGKIAEYTRNGLDYDLF
ncbi:twitch domain-containing radical SAM protein, partial [bacterium]|nr:twitch domain-containing radical SAM protein [bacterium]